MGIWKKLGFMLLGAAVLGGGCALAVGIGCAVNHIGFFEQIAQWASAIGQHKEVVEEVIAQAL